MRPGIDPRGLKKTGVAEYAVRFLFGGTVTATTGLIANHYGPVIGGLFLAFPAILPASLTLVKKHDGRRHAADDARGAALGTMGLAIFALFVWHRAVALSPPMLLLSATLAWALTGIVAWAVRYGSVTRSRETRGRGGRVGTRMCG